MDLMKAYLDHNLPSAIVKGEFPEELGALTTILDWYDEGRIDLRRSELHDRELEPYGDLKRKAEIKQQLSRLKEVPLVEDQEPIRRRPVGDQNSWVIGPLEDEPISRGLRELGVTRDDPRHLMVACRAACDVFLTCDVKTILNRRVEIEGYLSKFCNMRLRKPSEFVEQVTLDKNGKVIWSTP